MSCPTKLFILFLLTLLTSCSSDPSGCVQDGDHEWVDHNADSIKQAELAMQEQLHELQSDSLHHVIDSLVSNYFCLRQSDIPDSMYYLKEYSCRCCAVIDRITAYVSRDGFAYIVSSYSKDFGQNRLTIETAAGNSIILHGYQLFPGRGKESIGAWTYYHGDDVCDAVAALSTEGVSVKLWKDSELLQDFSSMFTVETERVNMQRCAELAKTITLLNELQL